MGKIYYNPNKGSEYAYRDFMDMTHESWTYNRLTEDERNRMDREIAQSLDVIRGTYKQKWETLQALYNMFLVGIGCTGYGWRK